MHPKQEITEPLLLRIFLLTYNQKFLLTFPFEFLISRRKRNDQLLKSDIPIHQMPFVPVKEYNAYHILQKITVLFCQDLFYS